MELFDELKVACANPARKLFGYKGSVEQKILVKKLSDGLTRATRFEMDNDFTRVVAAAINLSPAQSATLAQYTRPPYETMWVEWDENIKVQSISKIYAPRGNDTPGRIGFLIERDDFYTFPCYRIWVGLGGYYDDTPNQVGLSPIGYLLIPEVENAMTDFYYSDPKDKLFLDNLMGYRNQDKPGLFSALLMGWGYLNTLNGVKSLRTAPNIVEMKLPSADVPYLNEVAGRGRIIRGGYFGQEILELVTQASKERREDILDIIIRESNGTFRWLITLLGIMNTYQTVASEFHKPSSSNLGPRPINLRKVPFLEFRRLSVKLPVAKPIAELIKPMKLSQIRKRAHLVRGHYRHYKNGKVAFIKQHQRGDASLGFVHKEYLVESGLEPAAHGHH